MAFLKMELKYATSSTPQRWAMSPMSRDSLSSSFLASEIRIWLMYSVVVSPVIALIFLFSWVGYFAYNYLVRGYLDQKRHSREEAEIAQAEQEFYDEISGLQ